MLKEELLSIKRLISLGVVIFVGGMFMSGDADLGPLNPLKKFLQSMKGSQSATSVARPLPLPTRTNEAIRVASFNIQVFGEQKLSDPLAVDVLVKVLRSFDVIAVQEIRSERQDLLPRFVQQLNANGAHYDYAIGPRLGRSVSKEQYAYIFDAASLEIDRQSMYTVDDPDDLLHREPLVAGFRVRGLPSDQAFTFTLIDVHTDPDEVERELSVLDDVFREVRNDGRFEDDLIMLGDFNAAGTHLGELGQLPYLTRAIVGTPTNTRGTKQYDNLLFDSRATTEFTGKSGVVDLIREFNLSEADALRVSDHLPVWAEFSLREGGDPGRIATRPATPAR